MMQIYKVGGAVRDRLLGREVSEIDWVVVGASAEQMLELGYRPVGADFPVIIKMNGADALPLRDGLAPAELAAAAAIMASISAGLLMSAPW